MSLPRTDAERAAYIAEAARRSFAIDGFPQLHRLPELFHDPCPRSIWISERDLDSSVQAELHAIGIDHAKGSGDDREPATVEIALAATERPVVLFLMSYKSVRWKVSLAEGARLRGVYLSSRHPSTVDCPEPLEFVLSALGAPRVRKIGGGGRISVDREHDGARIIERIEEIAGLPLATFQGDDAGERFRIPCCRDPALLRAVQAKYRAMLAERTGSAPGPFWLVDRGRIIHHGGWEDPVLPVVPERLRAVVYDPEERLFYAISDRKLFAVERDGRAVEIPSPAPARFQWLGGIAFDSKRRRLVVSTHWHTGFHWICDLATGQWTAKEVGAEVPGGIDALAYDPGRDMLLAFLGGALAACTPDLELAGWMPHSDRLGIEPGRRFLVQLAVFPEGKAVVLLSYDDPMCPSSIATARLVDLKTQEVRPLALHLTAEPVLTRCEDELDPVAGMEDYKRRTGHYESYIDMAGLRRDAPRALAHLAHRTERMKRLLVTRGATWAMLATREHYESLVASVAESMEPDWERRLARSQAELDVGEPGGSASSGALFAIFTAQAVEDLDRLGGEDRAAVLAASREVEPWREGVPLELPFDRLRMRKIGRVRIFYELRDGRPCIAYLRDHCTEAPSGPVRATSSASEPAEGPARPSGEESAQVKDPAAQEAALRLFTWSALPNFSAFPELFVGSCPRSLFVSPRSSEDGMQFHVIGVDGAPAAERGVGTVRATVRATAPPLALLLMSRSQVLWDIELEENAKLAGVAFSGPDGCRVHVGGPVPQIVPLPQGPREISLDADRPEHVGCVELLRRLQEIGPGGLSSFQADVSQPHFFVPPERDAEAIERIWEEIASLTAERTRIPSEPFWIADRGWLGLFGGMEEPFPVPDPATKGVAFSEVDRRLYAITDSILFAIGGNGAIERIEVPVDAGCGPFGGITYDRRRGRILIASAARDGCHHIFDPVARAFREIPAEQTGGALHGLAYHQGRDVVYALRGGRLWVFSPELQPIAEVEHSPLPLPDLDARPTAVQMAALSEDLALCTWDEVGARAALCRDCDSVRRVESVFLIDLESGELHLLQAPPVRPQPSGTGGWERIWIADLQRNPESIIEAVVESDRPLLVESRAQPSVVLMSYKVYRGYELTLDEVADPGWRDRLQRATAELRSRARATTQWRIEYLPLGPRPESDSVTPVYVWTPQAAEDIERMGADPSTGWWWVDPILAMHFLRGVHAAAPLMGPFRELGLHACTDPTRERIILAWLDDEAWIAWVRLGGPIRL